MDPSYARKLLAYNKHTSDPDKHPNPLEDPAGTLAWMRSSGDDKRFPNFVSVVRARICAMNHDPVTATLWALSGFDPALVHMAELREHFRHLQEDDQIRISIDRLLSVYLEGQYRELLAGAGITKEEADTLTRVLPEKDNVLRQVLDCTEDPLAVEIYGYALWLGVLTSHGNAPWKRYAATVADCHAQLVH